MGARSQMNADCETAAYLEELARVVSRVGDGAVSALYATGSLTLNDFDRRRSDIDVLGLVCRPLSPDEKQILQAELRHDRLPCPANGLEFSLVRSDVAASPPRRPSFEFAMSTGHTWRVEVGSGEEDGEFALHFAICRQTGSPLFGPIPQEAFGPVPRQWLLEELDENLRWHAKHIFDPYHDPLGQFSILNGCRAWYFVEHDAFCSKTDGGQWVLSQNCQRSLVAVALANRSGETHDPPERGAIEEFLRCVCDIIESARSTQPSRPADREDAVADA